MNITVGRCTYPVRIGDYEPPDHEPCGEPAIVRIGAPRHQTADHAFEEVIVGAACQEHMFQEERRISQAYGGSTYVEPMPTAAIPADVAAVVAERDELRKEVAVLRIVAQKARMLADKVDEAMEEGVL